MPLNRCQIDNILEQNITQKQRYLNSHVLRKKPIIQIEAISIIAKPTQKAHDGSSIQEQNIVINSYAGVTNSNTPNNVPIISPIHRSDILYFSYSLSFNHVLLSILCHAINLKF